MVRFYNKRKYSKKYKELCERYEQYKKDHNITVYIPSVETMRLLLRKKDNET